MTRKPSIWTVYAPVIGVVYEGVDESEARRTARVYRAQGAEVSEERRGKQ
jgi:hypothetical protein